MFENIRDLTSHFVKTIFKKIEVKDNRQCYDIVIGITCIFEYYAGSLQVNSIAPVRTVHTIILVQCTCVWVFLYLAKCLLSF